MKITDFIDKDNMVYFSHYRQGFFYYSVKKIKSSEYYLFHVPIDDIGTATMEYRDKAITFMRWIRKSITDNTIQFLNPQTKPQ